MKQRIAKSFPLLLAAALQVMPLVRNALPTLAQALTPSSWAIVFRWAVGSVAVFGFDAISSASSIAISPPNATVGQLYVGTLTYSGGHAGSVSSMSLTNLCLGSAVTLAPGLTIVYNGGNTATVTGTPTAAGTFAFTVRMYDSSGCGNGGNTDVRSTTLVIAPSGGGGTAPSITAPPQSLTTQVGAGALFSAGASGNPTPKYFWYLGIPSSSTLISTSSTLSLANVQYSNAGLYTVKASNANGTAQATAYLSVALTPGSNQLALNYTNYYRQSNALTMSSFLTNAPAGVTTYKWQYNFVDIPGATSANFPLAANQVIGAKSGTYSVVFNSTVGGTTVVNQQAYYSFWAFGSPPLVANPPVNTNIAAGGAVAFSVGASGSNTLYYQWLFDATNALASQTNATLALTGVDPTNAGSYSVVITNHWGAVTSAPGVLTVSAAATAPFFITEPAPRSILVGQGATFSVTAGGTSPLSYAWQKNSQPISDGGVYSGTASNILTLHSAGLGDAGSYSVLVTNLGGATNSAIGLLTVSPPPALALGPPASGSAQLSATAPAGLTYITQTQTNLGSPWIPVATNIVPDSGQILFGNPATNPAQFFRLQFP